MPRICLLAFCLQRVLRGSRAAVSETWSISRGFGVFFSFVYVSYEYLYHVYRHHRATRRNLTSRRTLAAAMPPSLCVFPVPIDWVATGAPPLRSSWLLRLFERIQCFGTEQCFARSID